MRTLRLLVVLPVAAAAVVLGTASPGTAGGAKSTVHPVTVAFTSGDVTSSALESVSFADYVSTQYYDRFGGQPERGEHVSVGDVPCTPGSAFQSSLSIYGEKTDWFASTQARVEIACLFPDGSQHRFHWGNRVRADGSYDPAGRTNCVQVTGSGNVFTLTTGADCKAQEVVVNTRNRWVGGALPDRPLSFTASVTIH